MSLIGITGGVGTGKSLAAQALRDLGAVVFSADEAAREAAAPGSQVLRAIEQQFGPRALQPDGTLDRRWLADRVFRDPEARRVLESLTHPAILAILRRQIEEARARLGPEAVIVVEAPLLFEAGMAGWFDAILAITAPEEVQIARLMRRDGLTQDEARLRIAAQMPLEEKAARADFVVPNTGTPEDLKRRIGQIYPLLRRAHERGAARASAPGRAARGAEESKAGGQNSCGGLARML